MAHDKFYLLTVLFFSATSCVVIVGCLFVEPCGTARVRELAVTLQSWCWRHRSVERQNAVCLTAAELSCQWCRTIA